MQRVSNPNLETIRPDYDGNMFVKKRFKDKDPAPKPRKLDVLKWGLTKPFRELHKEYNFCIHVTTDLSFLENDKDVIIWFGHASFFIRMNGVGFFTDPIYDDLIIRRRKMPLPFDPTLIKNVDYLCVSHGHMDHLDKRSVKKILKTSPNIQSLTPLNMGKIVKRWGVKTQQEAGWYQKFAIPHKDVEVILLPAKHWHRRSAFDANKVLWGGFLIRTPRSSVFFAGDTAYGDHFKEIAEVVDIDVALLPIGAYHTNMYEFKDAHMDPCEATEAFNDLGAKRFVPMHHSTFDLSDEPLHEPISWLHDLHGDEKIAGELHPLCVGENFYF